ncbi:MAG: 5'-nucleotidase surE [uncultured bacterium]|nr:MAG: 5'-nucleotidase surE [uncultured bacterium]HBH18596.1 5'/3'-nucleotidase SurE [Cyanobacteria bacterium UBA9579]
MRILISNDDGIHAVGLRTLAERLAFEHEVYIIAPDRERSAAGHALTLHKPLRVEEIDMGFEVACAWETTGTPGDCIKIGISAILEKQPDIIISGINHGPNLGADVLYSGTVSAAMEGAVLGFPSIAVSLPNGHNGQQSDFIYTADFILKFINKIVTVNFPKKTILNINVPSIASSDIAGVRITRLGTRMYTDTYEKRLDPRGKTYYWLAGEIIETAEEDGTDITAIRNNQISITPVTFEMTHKSIMPELEKTFCNGICY